MTRYRPTGHQKHEYKIQEIEVGGNWRVGRRPKRGQTAFHFPYRRKLCAFHWTYGENSL